MGKAWAKVKVMKSRRSSHRSFGSSNRTNTGGREEFILKVEGFSGELRRTMTPKEAEEWVERTNKAAFMSAAKASKSGIYGVERFNKHGSGGNGHKSVIMRAAARGFADDKKGDKDGGEKE